MNALLPGVKSFKIKDARGKIKNQWKCPVLNLKAYVVCKKCNNGWMSVIEKRHAKPAISDLIAGKLDVPIPQSKANSIVLFAFKTAVILDYMAEIPEPFFARSVRHTFHQALTIPDNVRMTMAGLLYRGRGDAHSGYFNGVVPSAAHLSLYACSFSAGHFAFEVMAHVTRGIWKISPKAKHFDQLAVPFWPVVRSGFVWPNGTVIKSVREFDEFSVRWRDLDVNLL